MPVRPFYLRGCILKQSVNKRFGMARSWAFSRQLAIPFIFLFTVFFLGRPETALAQTPMPLAEWQYSAGVGLRSLFEDPLPEWDASAGIATVVQPRFQGSSQYHWEQGLSIDVRYKDIAFISTGEGLGWNIIHGPNYRAGVALTYDMGRDQDNGRHLHGMGDIAPAMEPKVFAEYIFFPVTLRADLRKGIGGNNGWVGDVSAYLPVYGDKDEKLFVFAGPTATYTDANYQQAYFGVTEAQSRRSGYRTFTPGAGFSSAGFGTTAVWYFTDDWFGTVDGGVQRLLGDSQHSPLTSSLVQMVLSFSINYQF